MHFDSNVNGDGMKEGITKTIAEVFVFVDLHLYYIEPDSPHGGLLADEGLFVRKQLEGGAYSRRGLLERGGLIESLRYSQLIYKNPELPL